MATRTNSSARSEVLAMLKEDHARAKKAFRDFERLDPEEDSEEVQALVERTCAELDVHARLEEELFYPAIRQVMRETDLIDEAQVEHMSLKNLISQLTAMTPSDQGYAATFKVLGEYVRHHVKEEENEIFPQLGRAKMDWPGLQQDMTERKDALMTEVGLSDAEAEGEGEERAQEQGGQRKASSRRGRKQSEGGRGAERTAERSAAMSQAGDDEEEESDEDEEGAPARGAAPRETQTQR